MTEARQDSAFYTNGPGHEVAWSDAEQPRFYVIRNGEMRVNAITEDGVAWIIRYTDQLEKFGIQTDEDLVKWTEKGEIVFNWINNSWFEVLDSKDSEYYSEPYHSLADAIGQAEVLYAEYGNDKEVE